MLYKEIVSDNVYRPVLRAALSIIDTCSASEIRNAALSRYACAAQEHNIIGFRDQLFKLVYLVFTDAAESVNPRFHY